MGKNKGDFFLCYYPLTDAPASSDPSSSWLVPVYDETNDVMYRASRSDFIPLEKQLDNLYYEFQC